MTDYVSLKDLQNHEARLRRRAARLGLRLSKLRAISCRGGRQAASYGGYILLDHQGRVIWPRGVDRVLVVELLDEVEAGLAEIERQS